MITKHRGWGVFCFAIVAVYGLFFCLWTVKPYHES
jgi:hypothetical protein